MSGNSALWLHVSGQPCVPVAEALLTEQLRSGTLPDDALVWIPGQRCWVQVDTLPGFRSRHQEFAPPPLPPLTAGSRVPPAVVAADPSTWAGPVDDSIAAAATGPAATDAHDDAPDAEVRLPRVVFTRDPSVPKQVGASLFAANAPSRA